MMITRLTIQLGADERNALNELANRELREPRDQVRLILRKELEVLGLLKNSCNDECDSQEFSKGDVSKKVTVSNEE